MPDLKVLDRDQFTGRLRVAFPRPPVTILGIDLLVQIVALLLMNNGGRSIVTPGRAGGLRRLLGQEYDPEDPSEIFADVRLIVSQCEQLIKEEQVKTKRPPSERLKALQLIDIVPDDNNPEFEIILLVVNEENQQSSAVVVP